MVVWKGGKKTTNIQSKFYDNIVGSLKTQPLVQQVTKKRSMQWQGLNWKTWFQVKKFKKEKGRSHVHAEKRRQKNEFLFIYYCNPLYFIMASSTITLNEKPNWRNAVFLAFYLYSTHSNGENGKMPFLLQRSHSYMYWKKPKPGWQQKPADFSSSSSTCSRCSNDSFNYPHKNETRTGRENSKKPSILKAKTLASQLIENSIIFSVASIQLGGVPQLHIQLLIFWYFYFLGFWLWFLTVSMVSYWLIDVWIQFSCYLLKL